MDEKYMQRCLELALSGIGNVSPNPLVGSVIVYKNRIIGEGYHKKYGEAHAEVNAIESVKDKSLLKHSSIYVSLEPCSHFGKTPPCSNLIIKMGIPRVIIGTSDTCSKVAGEGIAMLKEAGCEVITGVYEEKCRELNKRFFCFHENKRPYIILKWAQTRDGFIDIIRKAGSDIKPYWITNDLAKTLVHKWRSEEDSILIGRNAALMDNPKLTVRKWYGKDPIRLVTDRNLKLPEYLNVFDNHTPTIVFTEEEKEDKNKLKYVKIDFSDSLNSILKYLYENKIQSVFVEGGTILHNSFINEGLWDEARVFTGDLEFGNGVKAPVFNKKPYFKECIGSAKLELFKQ
ncbi:bifunctional diaminohydroxyphosphoribosylaminopyrimidine deaminase/5-amino-6-(5-phosphoribosylamino)uracil reductase RibD [Bacteroidota bacterium]